MGNQTLWESSALFITYDEHDGYFDHQLPPAPEPGTGGEFISSLPLGFGPRVPMIICSPWTRGGYVDSNVYEHTSMLRFLETWTGVQAANISTWRRSVAGDLTVAWEVVYTLTPNDYAGTAQTVHSDVNNPVTVNWPTNSDGYYDVVITASTSDGFTRRYGGRIG